MATFLANEINATERSKTGSTEQVLIMFPLKDKIMQFITHNTRILFHKAHLYKSIRFIFTCEKSLYSQLELRTAILHVEV